MKGTSELFQKRREIGHAIWLLTLYWSLQNNDGSTWAWVNGGAPVIDGDVAARLQISVFTAARWREKLRRAGVIQILPREHGFSVFAYRPAFAGRLLDYLGEPLSGSPAWSKSPTTAVQ